MRDLPEAELHMLDSGHFADEDSLDEIVTHIKRFHAEQVVGRMSVRAADPAEKTAEVLAGQPRDVVARKRRSGLGSTRSPSPGACRCGEPTRW